MEGRAMSNIVKYEFSLDSFISVETAAGTDPKSKELLDEARKTLIKHLEDGDFNFLLEKIYDPDGVMGQAESYYSPKKLNKNFLVGEK